MPQPFWEVELAKQHGKLINSAMDYSPESRTAPVFAMPRTAPCWQPPTTAWPAQAFAPASGSAPIVFSLPPVAPQSARMGSSTWQQTDTVRPPAARTASCAGDGDASTGLLGLGAKSKPLQHPPGWLAGTLIVVAAYVGNQLRHPEVPATQASAVNHPVVPVHAKRAKAR